MMTLMIEWTHRGQLWHADHLDDDDDDDDDADDNEYDDDFDATCVSSARSQYLPVRGNGQSHSSSLKIILESR